MQANVFGENWIVLCDDMYQLRTPATHSHSVNGPLVVGLGTSYLS